MTFGRARIRVSHVSPNFEFFSSSITVEHGGQTLLFTGVATRKRDALEDAATQAMTYFDSVGPLEEA